MAIFIPFRQTDTWRTFTGVKLNNNWNRTQYFRSVNFWQCNHSLEPELQ